MREYFVVVFMPVLHEGYLKLFRKYPGSIGLLHESYAQKLFPHLEREIRMVPAKEMKKVLESLGFEKVSVAGEEKLGKKIPKKFKIVMPDEDVTRKVAEIHFPDADIIFDTAFLRWDRPITLKENIVAPDRVISAKEADKELMLLAKKEADKSPDWWRQVGAVLVKGKKVLFSGYNKHLPAPYSLYINGDPRNNFNAGEHLDLYTSIHAESAIVASAAKDGKSIKGASVYVTTFPCPVCAKLLAESGVKKIYYSAGYSRMESEEMLKRQGIEIVLVKLD